MNTKIDWHYHLSGRNVFEDTQKLKKYTLDMEEVYVLALYFPKSGSGISNYNLYYHTKDIKNVKLFLSLDFEYFFYQGYNEISSILKENREKVKGIKIYTGYQDINNEEYLNMILKLAQKHNLYIMFHTGYNKGNQEAFNPLKLEKYIKEFSDINFILAHLSNPFYDYCAYLINNYDNVFADISGLVDEKKEIEPTLKNVREFSKKVDNNKILFGTDIPIQDYKTSLIFSNEFK